MRITGKGIWGEPADRAEAVASGCGARVELGIHSIDLAIAYGPSVSEENYRRGFIPLPGLVIATKEASTGRAPDKWVENGKPEHLKAACEVKLAPVATETDRSVSVASYRSRRLHRKTALGAAERSAGAGKIKHIGLSEVSVQQIQRAQAIVLIVAVQNRYSVTDRGSEDVLDYCEREEIGFIPWFPLGGW